MQYTIAIIGAGAMGSAVARRLVDNGARVITLIEGRSAATLARAEAAGMEAVKLADIAAADLILSIVPPATAKAVAAQFVEVLSATAHKPAYVDCNAISPKTMLEVVAILQPTGCEVIDGAIIGGPPTADSAGPVFYISADPNLRTEPLTLLGLKVRRIDGEIGAASALKMVYGGINKGMIGLAAAMLHAAAENDAGEGIRTVMAANMPEIQTRLRRSIPDMYPKAYRWVAEMQEIASFLGPDNPASQVFMGMAEVFAGFAADAEGNQEMIREVNGVLGIDG
jgi:NAD(P)-dependent dehydrogenase (short-subunit alcohol dehydrogenase family)